MGNKGLNESHIKEVESNRTDMPVKNVLHESIDQSNINQYWDYITKSKGEQMILLFIDITGFSTKMQNSSSEEIKAYLNRYYNLVLPIIHEYNGIVFQIIGDGILCFWGKPFSKVGAKANANQSLKCAQKLIKAMLSASTSSESYKSKIALHAGKVFYHEIKSRGHNEFTLSGQAITELFILESVSQNNAINFFEKRVKKVCKMDRLWNRKKCRVNVDGLGIRMIEYIEYNKP